MTHLLKNPIHRNLPGIHFLIPLEMPITTLLV